MEQNIFIGIGIFLILAVLTFFALITYIVSKVVLPKIGGRRNGYVLLAVFYFVLALGVSRCLLLAYSLIVSPIGN